MMMRTFWMTVVLATLAAAAIGAKKPTPAPEGKRADRAKEIETKKARTRNASSKKSEKKQNRQDGKEKNVSSNIPFDECMPQDIEKTSVSKKL